MHEMAVTGNILDIVVAETAKAGAMRVTRITLVIGELSSFIDESVQLYFDLLSEGTPAAGATLDFKRIPATLRCQACGHSYPKQNAHFDCPRCGGAGVLTGAGKEFYIESIEVE
jgi:hydrogenase nickel incorporation protein HypA/HybF